MRILMVSPHPVYSPRGTPISVFNRCLALGALGHQIDLVTYPVGQSRPAPGLRYLRAHVPGIRQVPVGPSPAKLVLNAAVAARALREATRERGRYDAVHTHEEAGVLGPALSRLCGTPHVYDMGNGWSDVLTNYGLGVRTPLGRLADAAETAVVRRSDVVIAHFPVLATRMAALTETPVQVVFNISLDPDPDPETAAALRRSWGAAPGAPVILYAGTLEPYQGIDLLLDAMVSVVSACPQALLVIVGGQREQVDALRRARDACGLSRHVRLIGTVPSPLVPACLQAADILVSPRQRGSNTPLKIFSYLRSGRPIVATDIPSHTQVLDDRSGILVPPTPSGLARGIRGLLGDGPRRRQAIAGALALQAEYGVERFVADVARAYAHIGAAADPDTVVQAAARVRAMHEEVIAVPKQAALSFLPAARDLADAAAVIAQHRSEPHRRSPSPGFKERS
jgi:glycosyltransferase involved in cell wall biosynthesis